MAAEEKWYFTKEQLANTPSRRCGLDADRELSNRQQAANFIQDMGQRLQVTQLCINTAIVYMHRFYVYHSFTHFHRNAIATAALFLAAKVEEQPRKLEHVIKVAHVCLHREPPPLDTKSDNYLEQAQDLVFNENVLLQTLSFDVAIDHPHTHVVRCCHMVKASKDLAQTSYFMASNSLHLTTMCLQYKPTVVACFCIHLACKWSNWEIPQSNEGKDWFSYVDKSVTYEQLETLTTEFIQIFDKCPTKLKRKIMSITASQNAIMPSQSTQGSQLFDNEPRKLPESQHSRHPLLPSPGGPDDSARKTSTAAVPPAKVGNKLVYDQYKEKKEKERMEREHKQAGNREGHHQRPAPPPGRPDSKMAPPSTSYTSSRPPSTSGRGPGDPPRHVKPSIFAPPPTVETTAAPTVTSSVNKNSSQEWPDKLNYSSELDTNRHHSDKYNSLGKDNNRHAETALKRPHSKDHRGPPSESLTKPSGEEAQRLYNSKYNHRKDEEALRRSAAAPPVQAPKRSDFSVSNKKDDPIRVAPASKLLMPSSHHPVVAKPPHRAPSPGSQAVPRVNPTAVQGRALATSQHRPSHRVPSPFPPPVPQARSLIKPPDSVDVKPVKPAHPGAVGVGPKLESRNGTVHPGEESKRSHPGHPDPGTRVNVKVEPGLRPDVKTEPGLRHEVKLEPGSRSQPDGIRTTTESYRSETLKPDVPKLTADAVVKTERVLPDTDPMTPPKSRTAVGNGSSHSHRPTKHHTPPAATNRKFPPEMMITPVGPMSPEFGSPPIPPLPTTPGKGVPLTPGSGSRSHNRNRTSSSSSEPELVPYIKKIEEIAGYENILDTTYSKKGIKVSEKLPLPGRVPDMIQPIRDRVSAEPAVNSRPHASFVSSTLKLPELIRPFSSQLPDILLQSEAPDLGATDPEPSNGFIDVVGVSEPEYIKTIIEPSKLVNMPLGFPLKSEHRHKSEKKKKKEKHKHKDKDKAKGEGKKKHKHKDRDREKNREPPPQGSAPIKITIPKEKILSSTIETNPPQGLKIKILKDRIKGPEATVTSVVPPVVSSGGLKLKISKDIIETYTSPMATKESRKRAISRTPDEGAAKVARVDPGKRQNGVRGGQHQKVEPTGGVSKSSGVPKAPH